MSGRPKEKFRLALRSHVLGLQSFRTLLHFKLDLLPFVQRFVAIALDRREVHEHVLAGLPLDEAVAFGCVKPLHNSLLFAQLRTPLPLK